MRKEFSIFKGLSIYYVTLDITILHWGRVFPIDYNIAGGTQNLYYVIYGQHLNSPHWLGVSKTGSPPHLLPKASEAGNLSKCLGVSYHHHQGFTLSSTSSSSLLFGENQCNIPYYRKHCIGTILYLCFVSFCHKNCKWVSDRFQVMTSFLILNLFVAVIMDNFDYLTR